MGTVIVAPREIDSATAPAFASSLEGTDIVIDCSRIEFIDSSGLRVLLEAREARVPHGGTVVLRSPTQAVMRLLEITATDRLFDVETS
jgi:anti-sigma B factor antagonist